MSSKDFLKTILPFVGVGLLILILFLFFDSKKKNEKIDKLGIVSTGIVISKLKGGNLSKSSTNTTHTIEFDFRFNDSTYQASDTYYNDDINFNNAVIGMRYKVKFLQNEKDISHNARIYIDSPILDSLNQIEKERVRIKTAYPDKKFLIKKYITDIKEAEQRIKNTTANNSYR